MDGVILTSPQLGKVLELIDLFREIFVNLLLRLIELLIVLLLPGLKESLLLISDLFCRTVDDSGQILDELFIITEIILRDFQGFFVDLD